MPSSGAHIPHIPKKESPALMFLYYSGKIIEAK
jgi:hypothetical protein